MTEVEAHMATYLCFYRLNQQQAVHEQSTSHIFLKNRPTYYQASSAAVG